MHFLFKKFTKKLISGTNSRLFLLEKLYGIIIVIFTGETSFIINDSNLELTAYRKIISGYIMAYYEKLERRISNIVSAWENTGRKKMFGGICYLLNGNMVGGIHKEYLILRLGEEKAVDMLSKPGFKPFDITGRPMKGWVMIAGKDIGDDKLINDYLEEARNFVKSLPSK